MLDHSWFGWFINYIIPRLLPGGVDFNLGYTVFVMRYITLSLSYTSCKAFEEGD